MENYILGGISSSFATVFTNPLEVSLNHKLFHWEIVA